MGPWGEGRVGKRTQHGAPSEFCRNKIVNVVWKFLSTGVVGEVLRPCRGAQVSWETKFYVLNNINLIRVIVNVPFPGLNVKVSPEGHARAKTVWHASGANRLGLGVSVMGLGGRYSMLHPLELNAHPVFPFKSAHLYCIEQGLRPSPDGWPISGGRVFHHLLDMLKVRVQWTVELRPRVPNHFYI